MCDMTSNVSQNTYFAQYFCRKILTQISTLNLRKPFQPKIPFSPRFAHLLKLPNLK